MPSKSGRNQEEKKEEKEALVDIRRRGKAPWGTQRV